MLTTAALFLIDTLFSLYIYVMVLRLALQTIRARFDNPLSQFAIKFTQPVVKPLQRFFPIVKGIDIAVIILALLLEVVKFICIYLVAEHSFPSVGGLLLLSIGDLLRLASNFYFYLIIFRVILGWIVPVHHNPMYFLLSQLTEPLLHPIRRIVPLIAGFDLSPLVALIALQLFEMLVADTLIHFGRLLA